MVWAGEQLFYEKNKLSKYNKIYFSYPNNVTLVLTKFGKKINLMPASWQTPLSYSPPLFGVLISPKRYTHNLLLKSKNFTLNFIEWKYAKLATQLGTISGKDINKIKKFNLKLEKSCFVKSPMLKIAYVSFECRLEDYFQCGDHTLLIGKILNVRCQKLAFHRDNTLNIVKVKPLLYLGNNIYATLDSKKRVQIRPFFSK